MDDKIEKQQVADLTSFEEDDINDKAKYIDCWAQYGHPVLHPLMSKYISPKKRGNVHILDLSSVIESVKKVRESVTEFLKKSESKEVLFFGRKKGFSDTVKEFALLSNSHYMIGRWPAGFLTNFKVLKKRILSLSRLRKILSMENSKMSKKNRSVLEKDKEKLEKVYEGVMNLQDLPSLIILHGMKEEGVILSEAKRVNIPVVSICDTDCNPSLVTYRIIGNDDGNKAVRFFLKFVSEAVRAGKGDLI